MACLYRSDLSKNLTSVLVQDAADAKKIRDSIDNFMVNAKANLKGDAYTAGINQLEVFKEAMEKRAMVMDTLAGAIDEAMSKLNDNMGEYDVLDDGMLEEIKAKIAECKTEIAELRTRLYYYRTVDVKDSDGNIIGSKQKKFEDQGVLRDIESYEALVREMEAKRDKLEGLAPAVEAAYNKFVSSVDSVLSSYESMVNNISIAEVVESV